MIHADMHSHTQYSHGAATPAMMYAAAREKNLGLLGFSEHSPRPEGYNYSHEYREKLTRHFGDYIRETTFLKNMAREDKNACQVLVGMEMDWLDGEIEFIKKAISGHDFDFLLGSVHFLDKWGFDDNNAAWANASQEECESRYARYFQIWKDMLASGLFHIAAHPDLIKIYSVEQFHVWLQKPESRMIIRDCLKTLRDSGMAMEISSAGLRKPCREIYPAPQIMEMAAELDLPISMASDAHCPQDVAFCFEDLAAYAKQFDFRQQTVFAKNKKYTLAF